MSLWIFQKHIVEGTSLVVQWLRLLAPNARGLNSIPGQGTRSHMPQLRLSSNSEQNILLRTKSKLYNNMFFWIQLKTILKPAFGASLSLSICICPPRELSLFEDSTDGETAINICTKWDTCRIRKYIPHAALI